MGQLGRSLAGTSPQVVPSRRSVLASRDFSARLGLATAHVEAGSMESSTCTTSHCRSFVTVERWISVSPAPLEAALAERRA